MARRKRNSSALERAERRIESLRSLDSRIDFGNGLTLDAYAASINDLRSKLAAYNTALSNIDKLKDDVSVAERVVTEISEKMLLGVGSRYGKTSQEYEMAGGSRRQSRRSTDKPASTHVVLPLSPSVTTNGTSSTVTR
jgi:hypothetical protein